jgi:hypothetical protein
VLALALSVPAWAAETVQYGSAPAWVTRAKLPPVTADAPRSLLFDSQQRIEGGTLHMYMDAASRVATPEALSQLATLVHDLSIHRGSERIDLLAKGQKFSVLRREETMEQQQLTGMLTASLPVEGLQLGDVLRLSFSVTSRDPTLKGHVENVIPVLSYPERAAFARNASVVAQGSAVALEAAHGRSRTKASYPQRRDGAGTGTSRGEACRTAQRRAGSLPAAAAGRGNDLSKLGGSLPRHGALVGHRSFIADGSPLAAEVAAIAKAEPTESGKIARALRLVQDKVRYLAVLMNGGNYVPQSPAKTWKLRYGDCKAKSLLLLAMLREMGIDAEAVLVSTQLSDWLPQRLPSAAAFDHVIIRATVDGRPGTRAGTRRPDIWDTPPFRHALPLRPGGATLVPIDLRSDARPLLDLELDVMVDSAIKDCTTAVGLSEVTAASLDSRAVVWFRLGRYEDALRDLDAAIAQAPGQSTSRFMRAVVLGKLGRTEEAKCDLAIARCLSPRIDVEYGRFGIKP